jgi:hypothetical protein
LDRVFLHLLVELCKEMNSKISYFQTQQQYE